MHLKAIIPLLVLSCLFLPSNCLDFVQDSYFVANRELNDRTVSFTVGSSAVFAFQSEYLLCGLNTATNTTFISDNVYLYPSSYAVVGDTAYLSYEYANSPIVTFNATTGQTSELPGSTAVSYRSLSAVGQNVYIAGGQIGDLPDRVDVNTLEIYDTTTKTTETITLPFRRHLLTSVPVGNYILFAGGMLGNVPQLDVTIFDVNTRTFTPTNNLTTNSINGYIQGVSIGQYAIFISGNDIQMFADVFDSSSMTWTTHSLSQHALSYGFRYQFSIVKNDRYVFLVAGGIAEIFDSFSQTWSTLYFGPTASNVYCPSTIVNNYALFGCYGGLYIVDISTFHHAPNTPGVISANVTSIGLRSFGATAIGDLAIFLTEDNGQMNVTTLDFSGIVTPPTTPVSAPTTVPPVAPPTVTGLSSVNPTDDATVRNGIYANNNYALEPTMYIKYSTNPDFTRQIYVKFPLHNLLPVGSSRVVVRLLGYYQSTLGPLNVQCYAVPNNAWTQSSITWNNKPALGALLSSTNITHPISYYEWDVTSYVTGQQSSGATFVSFAFVRNTPGPDESTVLINSVEADVNRPILAITN